MIQVERLSKKFGSNTVFREISLDFKKKETAFVLGRSGVGKSVLLKHLVGLLKADEGKILVDGEDVTAMDEIALTRIRKKCGMVFQFPALLDSLTISENVSFGIYAHNLASSEEDVQKRVKDALELVRLSEKLLDRYPPELSFGTQKRVAIARTLVIEPEYLLFDEPTTGMDPITTHMINELIDHLKKTLGVGAIVVSHDLESALAIGDRLILLNEGRAVLDGSAADFRRSSDPLALAFLKESDITC